MISIVMLHCNIFMVILFLLFFYTLFVFLYLQSIFFSNDVFSTYKHRDIVKGCKAHPGNIVEAALLAVCLSFWFSHSF